MEQKSIKTDKKQKAKEIKVKGDEDQKERVFREEVKLPPSMRHMLYKII